MAKLNMKEVTDRLGVVLLQEVRVIVISAQQSGRVEGWRGAKEPFPTSASTNPACGFPALGFHCQFHLKVYVTYHTGSTFTPDGSELRSHYRDQKFHTTKPYSICSSRSHGVFWHTLNVV